MAKYVNIDGPIEIYDTHGRKLEVSVRHIFEMNNAVYDAIEIVRCKDCPRVQKDELFNQLWCGGRRVTPDWFCADGGELRCE